MIFDSHIHTAFSADSEMKAEEALAAQQKTFAEKGLSVRETEVAQLLLEGKSYDDIAESLTISKYTVKRHAHNIYQKLDVANKVELINRFRQK